MQNKKGFPFTRQNYVLMLVGVGVVMLGFLLMALDSAEFGFGVLGLTVGPVTVLAGFIIGFFAIMIKPKAE